MIIIIIAILFIITALLIPIISWSMEVYANEPYIKFEQFLELYNKDSSKWELGGGHVRFNKGYYFNQFFNFKLIDYYMYRHWKRKLDKTQKEEKLQKIYDEIFKEINKDETSI